MKILYALIVITLGILMIIANMLLVRTAGAAIIPSITKMFCGPTAEIEGALSDYDVVLEGGAGPNNTSGKGRVMLNIRTGDWFFIQYEATKGTSCIVLGGQGLKPYVKGDAS